MPQSTEKVTFPNGRGQELAARLELPAGRPTAAAVFAHCFTCSKDLAAVRHVSRALRDRGWAVLRFDFTGLGNSEGDFGNTDFAGNIDDLVAATDHLSRRDLPAQLLVGHSLGGAAVIAAAPRVETVEAVATIGAPSDPGHVRHLFDRELEGIEPTDTTCITIAGRTFPVSGRFLWDVGEQNLSAVLQRLGKALLIFHSPQDDIVGIDHATALYGAARHPKSFVSLDGADHLLSRREDAEYVGHVLAAWAARYVTTEKSAPKADPTVEDGEVLVRSRDSGRFAHDVIAGSHSLIADEPKSVGGDDSGPNPYDFLLAALGTCTAMTLRMYADRKGWPLSDVSVRLRHSRVHASDCAECETREGRIDRIDKELTIGGELDAEQRARLVEIADRCPVHRTLLNEKEIRTELT